MDLSTVSLETGRMTMRAYREVDAPEIHAGVTPDVARYMTFEASQTVDELVAVGRIWLANQKTGKEMAVVLRDRTDGCFLGMSGLHYRNDPEPEVGIWIREDRWGQGLGREAVGTLVRFAGAALEEPSVVYSAVEANVPSRRIAEGLGGRLFDARTLKKPSGTRLPLVVYRIPTS